MNNHVCGREINLHALYYKASFYSDKCLAKYDKNCLVAMRGDY